MTNFKPQVSLLLSVLPEVAKETCFALHGGTAINLFVRDMLRLSVDIDLTHIPVEDRATSFSNISKALLRIKATVEAVVSYVQVTHKEKEFKLLIVYQKAQIKLEVNQALRRTIIPPIYVTLCEKTQEEFYAFCEIDVVPIGQLYGGKICAALDRQHPRYLFDGMSDEPFTYEDFETTRSLLIQTIH